MGCNTSKESVPQNEAETKENEEENHVEEIKDTKSASAKTITLRSNGTANSLEEQPALDNTPATHKEPGDQPLIDNTSVDNKEDQAATRIQAVFRGHKIRQSMKQPAGKVNEQEPEPTQQQLEDEFRPDDVELCHAATKIQASFRGHMTRKQMEKKEDEDTGSSQQQAKENQKLEEEELDIDLTDPDLNKAAIKIQASFRGHMVRKEDGSQ